MRSLVAFSSNRTRWAAVAACAVLALIVSALLPLGAAADEAEHERPHPPGDLGPIEDVQVYRTMMPDAGPSAFAVRFPAANLALCYDAVRGGVNYVWTGDFDLSPTVAEKINSPAEIEGEPFYRETEWHPLRTTTEAEAEAQYGEGAGRAAYRFRGYTVRDGVLTFRYTVGGSVNVRERIEPTEAGGIRRQFEVEPTDAPLYLRIEPQQNASVAIEDGEMLNDDWAVFQGEPLRQFAVTIEREQEDR